jgi:hypothetical protein
LYIRSLRVEYGVKILGTQTFDSFGEKLFSRGQIKPRGLPMGRLLEALVKLRWMG